MVDNDGVADAKHTSRLGLIIAKLARGCKDHDQNFECPADRVIQVHPKDGPPLSLDEQLRLALYLSPLRTVPVLHRTWHGLPRDTPMGAWIRCLEK